MGFFRNMKVGEEKIIETAHALFKQRGIRFTSMQKVARNCGISVSDVNLLFKSKKELMMAVVRHTVNKKTAYLVINSTLAPSAVTELETFYRFVEETIEALGGEILLELKRHHPFALDQLRDVVEDTLLPYLKKNIQRGFAEGFYREGLNAELYGSTYFYFLRIVLESECDWTQTKRAITHINDIFLHGVLNVKGMRI